MKKIVLCSLFTLSIAGAHAQESSLHENFDVSCALSSGFPAGWIEYNPVTGTTPSGQWTCGPDNGNGGTPGILCTGVYSSGYHLDTSYLITPLLNLSSYTGHVFLRFDTKTTNIHLGGRFSVIEAPPDTALSHLAANDTDISSGILPVIGSGDSSGWVTHEVDLTHYEGSGDFYIAFRYVSANTTGSAWYLDNVNTTTSSLEVAAIEKSMLPVTVIGNSTSSQITLSYSTEYAGAYQLAMYDIMGRKV